MCVIIIKQKGQQLPAEVAKTSSKLNPHGLGIIWMDTYEVTYHKSKEYRLLLTERPYIAHFRYATIGAVNRENTHPFVCGKNRNELLMMNGTIRELGDAQKCDSRVLAEQMGDIPRNLWKDKLEKHPCRFVTANTRNRTYQVYNRHMWTIQDGIWYSKSNVLQQNLVAVYGTLKKGHNNYYNYLTDSKFVASGTTKDKYPLIINRLPFMVDEVGHGHNVHVDVFKVCEETLDRLDRLEGHPNWYRRKQIEIVTKKGTTLTCWLYFSMTHVSDGQVLHESYEGQVHAPQRMCPYVIEPEIEEEEEDSEFDIENETPICVNCFHDVEFDEFSNYYCRSCDEWFKESEIVTFNPNTERWKTH